MEGRTSSSGNHRNSFAIQNIKETNYCVRQIKLKDMIRGYNCLKDKMYYTLINSRLKKTKLL